MSKTDRCDKAGPGRNEDVAGLNALLSRTKRLYNSTSSHVTAVF